MGPRREQPSDNRAEGNRLPQEKYDVKEGVASPDGLRDAIRGFIDDLWRVQVFHCQVRNQPGGTYDWGDRVVPVSVDELRAPNELAEGSLAKAENPLGEYVASEVCGAIAPLYEEVDGDAAGLRVRRTASTEGTPRRGTPNTVRVD